MLLCNPTLLGLLVQQHLYKYTLLRVVFHSRDRRKRKPQPESV